MSDVTHDVERRDRIAAAKDRTDAVPPTLYLRISIIGTEPPMNYECPFEDGDGLSVAIERACDVFEQFEQPDHAVFDVVVGSPVGPRFVADDSGKLKETPAEDGLLRIDDKATHTARAAWARKGFTVKGE